MEVLSSLLLGVNQTIPLLFPLTLPLIIIEKKYSFEKGFSVLEKTLSKDLLKDCNFMNFD